jgi:cytochrome oxidase Cu insertion factor (SCO1/SenC/PrrC family)
VLLTFSAAYYAGMAQKQQKTLPSIDGVLLDPPLPLPPINLYNQAGESFSNADFLDHWSLLMLDPNPGTTSSPALTRLVQVHNRLASDPQLQQHIHYYYLAGNKTEEMEISFSAMSDNIHLLDGDRQQLAETFELLGGYNDHIEHTLYLLGPSAKLHAIFTRNGNTATIAEDINNLINPMQ